MRDNPPRQLSTFGQSIWLDYLRRDLIASGALRRLIEVDGLRRDGYVSLEVTPQLAHDTQGAMQEARRFNLGKWSTVVKPVFKSKHHYEKLLEERIEPR